MWCMLDKVYDNLVVKACNYDELPSYNKVFNLSIFNSILHVYLKIPIQLEFEVVGIENLDDEESLSEYDYDFPNHPWIDIDTVYLSSDIGTHIYKIELINSCTNDLMYQYFSYTIQNDSPENTYMYMDREYLYSNED